MTDLVKETETLPLRYEVNDIIAKVSLLVKKFQNSVRSSSTMTKHSMC